MSGEQQQNVTSGQFLLAAVDPAEVFVPEDFSEEERMIAATTEKFMQEQVLPRMEALAALEEGLHRRLLGELGELGVFTVDVPEEYEGLGASKKMSMRLAEALGHGMAFASAPVVQAGIGGLPVVFFGNEAQRAKYLPGIMAGTTVTAYALTEPGSGSDALSARTTAVLDEGKGVYLLNGTKQFITNAGFADLFIVFAKVDGEHFTCFLVEKDFPGVSTGPEEKKMGLHGSSTRSLILEDTPVPVENVLGEVGKGAKIAFNVLNIGRLKLAPAVLGGAKVTLAEAMGYAQEREQFGKPLAAFPLIQQKIAGAVMRIYCTESMCYRTADLIDRAIAGIKAAGETDPARAVVQALRELAVECSINKVYSSEAIGWIADETVQIYGGYGYVSEYPAEGRFRDARIHRIWEGTSEINRMIITGELLDRAMKGKIPLLAAVKQVADELMVRRGMAAEPVGLLGAERLAVDNAKKLALFAAGAAAQKFGTGLQQEQEVLAWVADMVIHTFAMESALLRTLHLAEERDAAEVAARAAAVTLAVEDGMDVLEDRARRVLARVGSGDELRSMLSMARKLTRRQPADGAAAGRTLAAFALEKGTYPFS